MSLNQPQPSSEDSEKAITIEPDQKWMIYIGITLICISQFTGYVYNSSTCYLRGDLDDVCNNWYHFNWIILLLGFISLIVAIKGVVSGVVPFSEMQKLERLKKHWKNLMKSGKVISIFALIWIIASLAYHFTFDPFEYTHFDSASDEPLTVDAAATPGEEQKMDVFLVNGPDCNNDDSNTSISITTGLFIETNEEKFTTDCSRTDEYVFDKLTHIGTIDINPYEQYNISSNYRIILVEMEYYHLSSRMIYYSAGVLTLGIILVVASQSMVKSVNNKIRIEALRNTNHLPNDDRIQVVQSNVSSSSPPGRLGHDYSEHQGRYWRKAEDGKIRCWDGNKWSLP